MKRDDRQATLDFRCAQAQRVATLARGFTLIELVIVVAIVAILAAIAVPSYRNYVMHGNRNATEGVMLDMAAAEERYLIDNRGYTNSNAQLGYAGTVDANYAIVVATSSGLPPSYTITATPIAGGPQAGDTACNALTLDNAGNKSATGTSISQCWH